MRRKGAPECQIEFHNVTLTLKRAGSGGRVDQGITLSVRAED